MPANDPTVRSAPDGPLSAAQAARLLSVSIKALRLYEQRGLLRPPRTATGYRQYGPAELRAARNILALRAAGLSLSEIGRVVGGADASGEAVDALLARRQSALSAQFAQLERAGRQLRALRHERAIARSACTPHAAVAKTPRPFFGPVSFDLPWPWAGERFTLDEMPPLLYLVGPLGSGKTRLAMRLAEVLPGALFLPLHRLDSTEGSRCVTLPPTEAAAAERQLAALKQGGAVDEAPLRLLLRALHADGGRRALVVDMVEAGLSRPSQEALMTLLRRDLTTRAAPVVAMTRSSSILDLSQLGPGEAVLFCPANHAAPHLVAPVPGAMGHEALVSCLATPEVRARLAAPPRLTAP